MLSSYRLGHTTTARAKEWWGMCPLCNQGRKDREERRGDATYAGKASLSPRDLPVRRAISALRAASSASCLSILACIVARCARCCASSSSLAASRANERSSYGRGNEEEVSRGRKHKIFSQRRTLAARSKPSIPSSATS